MTDRKAPTETTGRRSPWWWVPTLYFAEGLPYMAVMIISGIMYKCLGISNTQLAFYTSWLYLPWVIKPFWSPFVDILRTKRWWVITMQWVIAIAMALIAFTIPAGSFFQMTLAVFWIMAFASATHDIAADGFYMLGLTEHAQSMFVGIRSLFYRISMVVGQGALVVLAAKVNDHTDSLTYGWILVFAVLSIFFLGMALYHTWALPRPDADHNRSTNSMRQTLSEFAETFIAFFTKPQIIVALLFMLLYRLPEAQLVKMIPPFLLDTPEHGGLGLSADQVGWAYGTVGVIGLMLGGIIGGLCAARNGLKAWLHPMAWSMSLTCLTFVYLAFARPSALWEIVRGAVRLRFRLHGLYALSDLFLRRTFQNGPLLHLHRIHGPGDDAPRHVLGMDCRHISLHRIFHLVHDMLCGHHRGLLSYKGIPFLRQKRPKPISPDNEPYQNFLTPLHTLISIYINGTGNARYRGAGA